jgi:hypothetical protein
MGKFKVWLRPSGHDCKIRIDDIGQAACLRQHLQSEGFDCTEAEPLAGGRQCVLHVSYPVTSNVAAVQQCVSHVPDAELMLDPA